MHYGMYYFNIILLYTYYIAVRKFAAAGVLI